jgi:hypothetical protein
MAPQVPQTLTGVGSAKHSTPSVGETSVPHTSVVYSV